LLYLYLIGPINSNKVPIKLIIAQMMEGTLHR